MMEMHVEITKAIGLALAVIILKYVVQVRIVGCITFVSH